MIKWARGQRGLERPGEGAGEAWRGSWFVFRFVILDERPLAVLAALRICIQWLLAGSYLGVAEPGLLRPRVQDYGDWRLARWGSWFVARSVGRVRRPLVGHL